jgi:GH15 family glucan-1,4-alpha-glucosidase
MEPEPDIADLAFLADRHGAALVDAAGSVAWLCLPRLDHGTFCAKLLDAESGGHITIAPAGAGADAAGHPQRSYVDGSLVLETVWEAEGGRARVLDLLAIDPEDPTTPPGLLLRICEGLTGDVALDVVVAGCFDYGAARPWIRPGEHDDVYALTAGDDGFLAWSDGGLQRDGDHGLHGRVRLREGDRWRLALRYARPPALERGEVAAPDADEVDAALAVTLDYWRGWSAKLKAPEGVDADGTRVSARVLHGLMNGDTGAIAAAATTSLPESSEGRTWDYRASWVRDSIFAVRSIAEIGCAVEADAFHRFVLRTAGGNAGDVRVLYGMGGERRLPELEIGELRGWRGIGPVRVGNGAVDQRQNDVLGELVNLSFRQTERGFGIGPEDWRFLRALADRAAEVWDQPDRGLWEWRGEPRHFVHSKALCWSALDRGLRLADMTGFDAPRQRWTSAREAAREAIDRDGVDRRGVFVQAFGSSELDAAALLLPMAGYCAWDDPRMIATADAVAEELDEGGLLRRYRCDDGQPGREHPFVACTFWLAECLAHQGRAAEGRAAFDRALATRTELGLFAEEADPHTGALWGNTPQALTHLAHIGAALALAGDDLAGG